MTDDSTADNDDIPVSPDPPPAPSVETEATMSQAAALAASDQAALAGRPSFDAPFAASAALGEPDGDAASGAGSAPWGRRLVAGAAAVVLALGAGTSGALIALALDSDAGRDDAETAVPATERVDLAPPGTSDVEDEPLEGLAALAAQVMPTVVSIEVDIDGDRGQGSGVVLSDDGLILTNNHVVDGASELRVTFDDGTRTGAEVLGGSPETDLAVLQAEGVSGLTPAVLGSSAELSVGDPVIAIGSPLSLTGSVTSGIVSALNRDIRLGDPNLDADTPGPVTSAIQTDAAINPGNSGGPLINMDGEVVGINTAIAAAPSAPNFGVQGNIGIGFSIPVDDARRVVEELIDTGEVTIAFLGVNIEPASVADPDAQGAAIAEPPGGEPAVTPGSPADEAGLQEGDIIIALDDQRIDDSTELTAAVRRRAPGDEVTITFVRDGEERTVEVTLGTFGE